MTAPTTSASPTLSELCTAVREALRPLRGLVQLEKLLDAAVVDDERVQAASATRARLEAEIAALRDTQATEKRSFERQMAAARSSLQSVTAQLAAARESLATTQTEYESLRRRITGVTGG